MLPVLLLATIAASKDEVTLYEDGAFVPMLNGATVERLLRAPERFEVQRLFITGPRSALYRRLVEVLSAGAKAPVTMGGDPAKPSARPVSGLVPIVRQLVRVVRELPELARTTKAISPAAQALREALLRAREPATLLFRDLPIACGVPPFEAEGTTSGEEVERFIEGLRAAVRELRSAPETATADARSRLRVAVTLPQQRERSMILSIQPEHDALIGSLGTHIQNIAARLPAPVARESVIAALGIVMHGLMSEIQDTKRAGEAQASA